MSKIRSGRPVGVLLDAEFRCEDSVIKSAERGFMGKLLSSTVPKAPSFASGSQRLPKEVPFTYGLTTEAAVPHSTGGLLFRGLLAGNFFSSGRRLEY